MPASEHSLPAKIAAMLPTPRTTDSHGAGLHGQGGQDLRTVVSLLPTPAVNDMGEGKTLEWWDDWAPRQKAADGRPAPHGRSLAIEAQRLLPTPRATDGTDAPANLTPSVEAICDGSAGRTPRLSEMAVGRMLPTPTSQAAKHGETPDTTASGYGSNLWDLPSLLPTPKATNNENRQSLDRYGMNLGMALESIGAITAPPLSDGSASLDDQPHRQLSLDELAHPA